MKSKCLQKNWAQTGVEEDEMALKKKKKELGRGRLPTGEVEEKNRNIL